MTKNKDVTQCQNCGNSVHGFWKYGENKVCSLKCLRARITNGSIPKLFVERAYSELGISAPAKGK